MGTLQALSVLALLCAFTLLCAITENAWVRFGFFAVLLCLGCTAWGVFVLLWPTMTEHGFGLLPNHGNGATTSARDDDPPSPKSAVRSQRDTSYRGSSIRPTPPPLYPDPPPQQPPQPPALPALAPTTTNVVSPPPRLPPPPSPSQPQTAKEEAPPLQPAPSTRQPVSDAPSQQELEGMRLLLEP